MLRLRVCRWLGAAALLLGTVVLVAACGGDDGDGDDGGESRASAETTAAETVEVEFAGSPEEGLPTSYPEPKSEALDLGVLSPISTTEVVQVIDESIKSEVERLGGTAKFLYAEANPDTQVSQFEQLMNEKVDAIIMAPVAGPAVIGPLLQQAAKAKVPVISTIDVVPGKPGPVPGFVSQIWHRRDQAAYLQVKAAAEQLPPGSEIGQVTFALPIPLFEYTAQRQAHWAKEFGLEIAATAASKNDTTAGGEEAATGLIANNPNLKGILGYNDEPAIGAALAARAAGKPDVKTFGITGGELARTSIENDRLAASVYFDAVQTGRLAVIGAYDAVQGTEIPPVVLTGDAYIIDKENVDTPPEEAVTATGG